MCRLIYLRIQVRHLDFSRPTVTLGYVSIQGNLLLKSDPLNLHYVDSHVSRHKPRLKDIRVTWMFDSEWYDVPKYRQAAYSVH